MKSFRLLAILLPTLLLINTLVFAEPPKNPSNGDEQYLAFAEVMPEPAGGMASIVKHIVYPDLAKQSQVEGRVYVLAYIDEDGSCSQAKIIKGIGAGCDEAAVNAVKAAKYSPGKNKGVPVKVKLSLPIEFKL